jgi:hypothetical protein
MSVKVLETLFSLLFLVEWVARLIAFHPRLFCCSAWNIFDTVIVFSALLEECTKYAASQQGSFMGKISALRVMRTLKLLRALRIIRVVRAFRELRIVLVSIVMCLRQLVWTLMLLLVMVYMVCILILVELTGQDGAYSGSELADIRRRYFSDLPRALMTLYQCTTFGLHWGTVSTALEQVIPWMGIIWMMYMGFVVFAFQNTVMGMCVDQAIKSAQDDVRNVNLEEHEMQEAAQVQLRQMLLAADPEGRGFVGSRHFRKLMENAECLSILKECDVDYRDLLTFFHQVTHPHGTLGLADIDHFLLSAFRLKGSAQNVDLQALVYKHKVLMRKGRFD